MSEKEQQAPRPTSSKSDDGSGRPAGAAEPNGGTKPAEGRQAVEEETQALQQALEEAQAKAQEHWDRLVRTTAELDNVRKRADREVEAARKYALEKFATELLAVRDSLEMGLASARESNESNDSHVQGMELTLKMLTGVMDKFNIQSLNPVGEPFNPEYHEAVSAQASAEQAPNTVLSVMQKGYILNDRLLRPAMVVVAKAPENQTDDGAQS